jgi:uncharacterized protein (DUF302 family)
MLRHLLFIYVLAIVLLAPAYAAEETAEEGSDFYFSKMLELPFDEAKSKVTDALKAQGFAVLTEIDMRAKFKEKLGKDIPRYLILGACGAGFAYKAWEINDHVGVMLPCTVVLHEEADGEVEVLIRNPRGLVAFDPELEPVAEEVYGKMQAVLAALE